MKTTKPFILFLVLLVLNVFLNIELPQKNKPLLKTSTISVICSNATVFADQTHKTKCVIQPVSAPSVLLKTHSQSGKLKAPTLLNNPFVVLNETPIVNDSSLVDLKNKETFLLTFAGPRAPPSFFV